MGLIKAGIGAVGGVLADQWKEFFYCDAIDQEVLAVRGQKQIGSRSSNTKGNDNIISNGSGIAVADGQCMMIVEQGKVVELCAEPGEFIYDTSTEPSIFTGKLSKNILEVLKTIGKRFTYGGDTGKDQRVYYFNTKEIVGNKYGTQNPIPFRVVDTNIGMDIDVAVRCNGVFSYKIDNPPLFYTNVCGNFTDEYRRSSLDEQLKTELLTALQPAFAKISELGIRYSALPAHTTEITESLKEILSEQWTELRGITIVSFGLNSATISDEDAALIKDYQQKAALRDPAMGAAVMTGAYAQAMQDAAKNEAGAMTGFMGMGFAANSGAGNNIQGMYQMAADQKANAPAAGGWTCGCGTANTGKFCSNCGKPQPSSWTCSCGTTNTGKFCSNCGNPQPSSWTCSCGTENTGKFCSNCGKPNENN